MSYQNKTILCLTYNKAGQLIKYNGQSNISFSLSKNSSGYFYLGLLGTDLDDNYGFPIIIAGKYFFPKCLSIQYNTFNIEFNKSGVDWLSDTLKQIQFQEALTKEVIMYFQLEYETGIQTPFMK